MRSQTTALIAVSLLTAASVGMTQAAAVKKRAHKAPVAKHAAKPGVRGTKQMAGGDGVFGQTYTLKNGPNFTLDSAAYSVERLPMEQNEAVVPKADEKLLILRFRVQNPRKEDMYLGRNFVTFATVAKDGQTRDGYGDTRLVSQKVLMGNSLKPGQKFQEEVITTCIVPAAGPVPKLILNSGREGTNEQVTRYALGQGKNVVKPLPAPYADPADPTGATARTEVPAQIGTTYTAGNYDLRVDSIAFAPGPFGDTAAGDGNRFLVATVTLTNKIWDKNYFNEGLAAALVTSDDEKAEKFTLLKGKRDEPFEGRQIDPGETFTVRLAFDVPKDATGKTLKIAEVEDNLDHRSRAFVYDLSGVQ